MAKACRGTQTQEKDHLNESAVAAETEYGHLFCISQATCGVPRYMVYVEIDVEQVKMTVDSGAAWSIISQRELKKISIAKLGKLEEPSVQLISWTKQRLQVLGKNIVPVNFKGRNC